MYYSKEEISQYIQNEDERLKKIGLTFVNSIEEIKMNLENERELVTVFWLEPENGEINMNGKSFYKVDTNLYTDDRFAIDLFIAAQNNTTVSDLVKARMKQKESMKTQSFKHIQELYNILTNKKAE